MTEAEIATAIASETVKISFNGVVAVMKVAGKAGAHATALLAAVLSGKKKSKGKVQLQEMLKEGVSLISIKEEDRTTFAKAARKYGIKYCIVKDKNNNDGTLDVFVRSIDAAIINRIMDKYEMAVVEQDVSIVSEEAKNDVILKEGDVTIDKGTLVVEETPDEIRTRVPGTYGNNVKYLYLDRLQVAEINEGKTYQTHFDREAQYKIYDKDGQVELMDGGNLLAHYDKHERQKDSLKNSETLTETESLLGKNSEEHFKDGDITISRSKNTLVVEETPDEIRTRIPGTFGDGERHVYFYREELTEAYGGKSYRINIDRQRNYSVYDKNGILVGSMTGEALLHHYDTLNDKSVKPIIETKPSIRERMEILQHTDKTMPQETTHSKSDNVVSIGKSKSNSFNNIDQRNYDFDSLEKQLVRKQGKEHDTLK